ncbi:hypothetical protein EDB86DRAFT_2879210 [Lactarius hatsudake]|nr:hypothetical protein EDB86DRAFT_2879210 [Lactarius hatsudake]
MAQILRTPKSCSDWTANELCAYNITVVPQSKEVFLGTTNFPDPTDPSLTGRGNYLHYLDLATDLKTGQEAAVVNFAAELLSGLEYDEDNKIVFIRHAIPFLLVEKTQSIDVCITDDNEILLLLQEDKRLASMKDSEPQVIAEAIAALALNNRKRERDLNLPPCHSIMFPCITMAGTTPVSYKITITAALSKERVQSVRASAYKTRCDTEPGGHNLAASRRHSTTLSRSDDWTDRSRAISVMTALPKSVKNSRQRSTISFTSCASSPASDSDAT